MKYLLLILAFTISYVNATGEQLVQIESSPKLNSEHPILLKKGTLLIQNSDGSFKLFKKESSLN